MEAPRSTVTIKESTEGIKGIKESARLEGTARAAGFRRRAQKAAHA